MANLFILIASNHCISFCKICICCDFFWNLLYKFLFLLCLRITIFSFWMILQ